MRLYIDIEGVNHGYITTYPGMTNKEFMDSVNKLIKIDLETEEDLDLQSKKEGDVINFSLNQKMLSENYLERIGKCNIESFIKNTDIHLLDTFLRIFDIDETSKISGYTALTYHSGMGNVEMVEMLIKRNANLDKIGLEGGNNAIFLACKNKEIEIINLLSDACVDLESQDENGMTILNIMSSKCGYKEVVELLMEKGSIIESKDDYGRSSLYSASMGANKEVLKLFIDIGADIESKDIYGRSPLYAASMVGDKEVVKLLIDSGADIESKDEYGRSPLYAASLKGYKEVVKLLIDRGADVNSKNDSGESPLHAASIGGSKEVVKLLIAGGADVNSKNNSNESSLNIASMEGYKDIVKFLIAKGANLKNKDKWGRSSLYLASMEGHEKVVKLLIIKGDDINNDDCFLKGDKETVELLISKTKDKESEENLEKTRINDIITQKYKEIIELLNAREDIMK